MSNIVFSHNYPKLWNQKKAELIAVREINSKEFNLDLLEYDTKYNGGKHTMTNIVACCKSCNVHKGVLNYKEFIASVEVQP